MSRPAHRIDVVSLALASVVLQATTTDAAAPTSLPAVTRVGETWRDAARSRDVPVRLYLPADASRPAATVIVSHGLGDGRDAMAFACRAWAARGMVVVALEHAGSDWRIWNDARNGEVFGVLMRAATPANFVLRCGDVSFAIDELARRAAPGGSLAGRIDLDRIGVAGHSFGALTAQAVVGERFAPVAGMPQTFADARVKACVLMSPGLEGAAADLDAAFAGVRVPVAHFTGTADTSPGLGITLASRRRVPFDRMPASDQYLVIFDRGDHLVFSGHRPRGANDARYDLIETRTATLSADFFAAHLQGDAAARRRLDDGQATLGTAGTFERKSAAPTTP